MSDYFENEAELDSLSFVGPHLVVDKGCLLYQIVDYYLSFHWAKSDNCT
jgi:hypothetical protein